MKTSAISSAKILDNKNATKIEKALPIRRLIIARGAGDDKQGQSVFHNAQELEEFAGAIAEIAEGDGDFVAAGQTQV
jgi:hypothetical protein